MLCSVQSCSLRQHMLSSAGACRPAGAGCRPVGVLRHARAAHCRVVVAASKKDLAHQIDDTQKTLAKVVEAMDAAHAPDDAVLAISETAPSVLHAREQQLWDRQQALFERELKRWDEERQAWREREADLLEEMASMRREMRQLLVAQQQMLLQLPRVEHTGAASSAASNELANAVVQGAPASSSTSTSSSSGPSTPSQPGTPAWMQLFEGGGGGGGDSTSGASSSSTTTSTASTAPTSSTTATSTGSAAKPAQPTYIDSFKAAFAAVDEIDILNQDVDFSRIRQQAAAHGSTGSSMGNTTAQPGSSTAKPVQEEREIPVEVVKAPPDGPPPVLSLGDDDIYWVSKLHEGLVVAGFHPHDEALDNWLFEETTQTALLMYQACHGLDETGVADEETWAKMLGDTTLVTSTSSSITTSNGLSSSSSMTTVSIGSAASSSSSPAAERTRWPVLMDTDGGREVHVLQLLLGNAGYYCGEDEMRWWMFGDTTAGALKTFQACNGLPESGVCDERTWRVLLGPDAVPSDVDQPQGIASSDEFEEDMTTMPAPGAVWLLGEQRWALP